MAERPTPDPMSPVMRAALLRGLTNRRSLMAGALGLGRHRSPRCVRQPRQGHHGIRRGRAGPPRPPPRT